MISNASASTPSSKLIQPLKDLLATPKVRLCCIQGLMVASTA